MTPVYAAMAVHTLVSAGGYLVMQQAVTHLTPLEVAYFRFLIAGTIYGVFLAGWQRSMAFPAGVRWRLLVLGLCVLPINQGFFAIGMTTAAPTRAAIFFALTPAVVLVGAAIFLRERISSGRLAGIVVAFVGAMIVLLERVVPKNGVPNGAGNGIPGEIWLLGSVIAWAAYTILARPVAQRIGALRTTGLTMVISAVGVLPWGVFVLRPVGKMAAVSATGWACVAYLAIVTGVLAYALWAFALRRMEAARVAVFTNLQPVATAVLAFVILAEPITGSIVGGGVLVIVGITMLQRATPRPNSTAMAMATPGESETGKGNRGT